MLGSSFFIGWAAGLLWLPPIGDKHGRWKPYYIGNVIRTICYTFLMFSKSYLLSVIMIFILGLSENLTISIGFHYFNELIGEPYRKFYGTIWQINEGTVALYATLWFAVISINWVPFISIGYGISIAVCITTYFLPESPCWLVNRRLYDEADKVWEYIAKFNGTTYTYNKDFFATRVEHKSEIKTVADSAEHFTEVPLGTEESLRMTTLEKCEDQSEADIKFFMR